MDFWSGKFYKFIYSIKFINLNLYLNFLEIEKRLSPVYILTPDSSATLIFYLYQLFCIHHKKYFHNHVKEMLLSNIIHLLILPQKGTNLTSAMSYNHFVAILEIFFRTWSSCSSPIGIIILPLLESWDNNSPEYLERSCNNYSIEWSCSNLFPSACLQKMLLISSFLNRW